MARRPPETVGGPAPRGLELELRRALKPMVAQARRAGAKVRTPAEARALGVALRKAWPDKRIAQIVAKVMRAAEVRASAGWGQYERKVAARRGDKMSPLPSQVATIRTDAPRLNIGDYATWPDLNGAVARSVSSKFDNVRKVTVIEWELADGTRITTIGLPRGIKRAAAWAKLKPYDGAALVEEWSKSATKAITSVRDEVAERMRKDIVAALESGKDASEVAAGWAAEGIPVKFGTVEGRLRVIAQHQIANLHAQVQSERARAIGATEFDWITQEDDKVRAEHRRLHGTRHRYDDPPSEGLPGQPINCRCFARVVIPDELLAGITIGTAFDT